MPRLKHLRWLVPVLALVIPVGVAIASIVGAVPNRRSRKSLLCVLTLWTTVFAPILIVVALARDFAIFQYAALILTAVGLTVLDRKLLTPTGWLIALCIIVALQLAGLHQSSVTFAPADAEQVSQSRLVAGLTGVENLKASPAASTPWYRDWQISTSEIGHLSLEVRASFSSVWPTWFLRDAHQESTTSDKEELVFANQSGVAWRTFESSTPLGGRTFRLRGAANDVRSILAAAEVCDLVVLKVDAAPWINSCGDLTYTNESASEFEVRWTVPESVSENRLRIESSAADSGLERVELRILGLVEESPSASTNVVGILPVDVVFRVDALGSVPSENSFEVTGTNVASEWTPLELALPVPPSTSLVRATLRVPANIDLQVRSTELTGLTQARSLPRPSRQGAWFGHPNTLAVVVVGLLLAQAHWRRPSATTFGLILIGSVAVGLSGSRAGLILFAAAAIVTLLAGSERMVGLGVRTIRTVITVATISLMIVVVGMLSPRLTGGAGYGNAVPRTAIWSAAVDAILARPGLGWGSEASLALNSKLGDTGTINHAHNWWLELGVRYGLPGLAAGLWATILVVVHSARRGPYAALALGLLLLSNLVDSTLLTIYTWVPIFLLIGGKAEKHLNDSSSPSNVNTPYSSIAPVSSRAS